MLRIILNSIIDDCEGCALCPGLTYYLTLRPRIIFHSSQVNRCRLLKGIVSHTPSAQARVTIISIKPTFITLFPPLMGSPSRIRTTSNKITKLQQHQQHTTVTQIRSTQKVGKNYSLKWKTTQLFLSKIFLNGPILIPRRHYMHPCMCACVSVHPPTHTHIQYSIVIKSTGSRIRLPGIESCHLTPDTHTLNASISSSIKWDVPNNMTRMGILIY